MSGGSERTIVVDIVNWEVLGAGSFGYGVIDSSKPHVAYKVVPFLSSSEISVDLSREFEMVRKISTETIAFTLTWEQLSLSNSFVASFDQERKKASEGRNINETSFRSKFGCLPREVSAQTKYFLPASLSWFVIEMPYGGQSLRQLKKTYGSDYSAVMSQLYLDPISHGPGVNGLIDKLFRTARSLVDAIWNIHSKGVTHGDLSDSNVGIQKIDWFFGAMPIVRLFDFGAARSREQDSDCCPTAAFARPGLRPDYGDSWDNLIAAQGFDADYYGATWLLVYLLWGIDAVTFKKMSTSQLDQDKTAFMVRERELKVILERWWDEVVLRSWLGKNPWIDNVAREQMRWLIHLISSLLCEITSPKELGCLLELNLNDLTFSERPLYLRNREFLYEKYMQGVYITKDGQALKLSEYPRGDNLVSGERSGAGNILLNSLLSGIDDASRGTGREDDDSKVDSKIDSKPSDSRKRRRVDRVAGESLVVRDSVAPDPGASESDSDSKSKSFLAAALLDLSAPLTRGPPSLDGSYDP